MSRPRLISDEQILEAAREVFINAGPKAPISLIAKRLGVSAAAIFKRFGSKEDLLIAALSPPGRPSFAAVVDAAPSSDDLRGELLIVAREVAAALEQVVPAIMALEMAGIEKSAMLSCFDVPPPVLALRSVSGFFQRAKQRGLIREDVEPLAVGLAFLGALHTRAFMAHVMSKHVASGDAPPLGTVEPYLEQVVDMVCGGVASLQPSSDPESR